ncbi:MAG: terminase large subunit domain-containing protein [Acetanaerobacterium sp.]
MTMNCNIQDYITLVRGGTMAVCTEQLLLCDYVERCFEKEALYVDEQQLEKYLDLQKYFPFALFEWERFCFALHNCTYTADGQLRWPDLLIMVGRGAGKNGYIAFEDFCLLTPINGIPHYDIDICATAEEQAKISFDDIYDVLESNKKKLSNHFRWTRELIENLKTKSKLRFRTSNAKSKDGGRPGLIDFDEYHAYENYKLIEVFKTGFGKKAMPRTTITTTSGDVRDGPLDHILASAEQILKGEIPDNGLLPFICRLNKAEQVHDKRNWTMANPSLPYFPVLMREMEKEYGDYLLSNLGNSAFMTKRMNLPQGDKEAEVTSWENIWCTNRPLPDLSEYPCVAGIDYMKTTDFLAAGLLFTIDDIDYWITHSWVCRSGNDLSRIKFPLEDAAAKGLLTFVDDVEIGPEVPALWLQEQGAKYNILACAIDSYRYTLLSKALREVGFSADKKGANNLKLVRPSDEMLISPVITSTFAHHAVIWGDNPLMRWYTHNSKMVELPSGNIIYGKIEPKSRKTDGFKAYVAAKTISDRLEGYGKMQNIDLGVYTY